MMKRVSGAAVLFLMTVLLFILMRPKPPKAPEQVQPGNGLEVPASTTTAPGTSASSEAGRENSDAGRSPVTQQTDNVPPNSSIPTSSVQASPMPPKEEQAALEQELENVQFMVRGFRDALGENPVGNNAEITRALMGDNTKQVKMPLPGGSSLNEKGELTDRWGTPYFFHQLSAKEMEIRSAGPDRKMWTDDDRQAR